MSLIAMAVHDTKENGRTELTKQTLISLMDTVDLDVHRLFIIDNGSCEETKKGLASLPENITVITNPENVGTAKAINQAWKFRLPNEHLIKMDNDVVINGYGWVEELEDAIERDTSIGIIGLKRNDLIESPFRNDEFKSTLRMLPHELGQRWIIVEDVNGVMGTCQMFNYRLIDKMGGLMQMEGLYGFDDTLASVRSTLSGFKNCFIPHIEIDHIDKGGTDYTKWKQKYASEMMDKYNETKQGMIKGTIPIYYEI